MHGLWPDDLSLKKKDVVCKLANPISFTPGHIGRYWPSFRAGKSSSSFIEDEYRKHGRKHFPKKIDFVNTVRYLMFREDLDVFRLLEKNGIVPSDERSYTLAELRAAFSTLHYANSSVVIQCHSPWGTDKSFLKEIWMCLTVEFDLTPCESNTWMYFDCPEDNIYYPRRKRCERRRPESEKDPWIKAALDQCKPEPEEQCTKI